MKFEKERISSEKLNVTEKKIMRNSFGVTTLEVSDFQFIATNFKVVLYKVQNSIYCT